MKIKNLFLLGMLLSTVTAWGSPITVDVISAPDGVTIQNGHANLTLPTGYVTESILTQSNAVSMSNKTFDGSSNISKQAKASYDFSLQGGSTGLVLSLYSLPANAVIVNAWMDVITSMAGPVVGGATSLELSTLHQGDIMLHQIPSYLTAGVYQLNVRGDSATIFKNASATSINLKINGGSLNAGKFNLYVNYLLSN